MKKDLKNYIVDNVFVRNQKVSNNYKKVKVGSLHLTKQCWKSLKNFEKHIYSEYKNNIKITYALAVCLMENFNFDFDTFFVKLWLKDFIGKRELWAYGV